MVLDCDRTQAILTKQRPYQMKRAGGGGGGCSSGGKVSTSQYQVSASAETDIHYSDDRGSMWYFGMEGIQIWRRLPEVHCCSDSRRDKGWAQPGPAEESAKHFILIFKISVVEYGA